MKQLTELGLTIDEPLVSSKRASTALCLVQRAHRFSALNCLPLCNSLPSPVSLFPVCTENSLNQLVLHPNFASHVAGYSRLVPVCVYGTQGCGKSTLLNIMCKTLLFPVGRGQTETRGIAGAILPHPEHPDIGVLLLDTAGTGLQRALTLDVLTIALLCSHVIIFNVNGTLDGWRTTIIENFKTVHDIVLKRLVLPANKSLSTVMESVCSSLIVVQKNRERNWDTDFKSEWNALLAAELPALKSPFAVITCATPTWATSDTPQYPRFWAEVTDAYRADITRLLCYVGMRCPNVSSFGFPPRKIVSDIESLLTVLHNSELNDVLRTSITDIFISRSMDNFQLKINRLVECAGLLRALPYDELLQKWIVICNDPRIRDTRALLGETATKILRHTFNGLKRTNIELVIAEVVAEMEGLAKKQEWNPLSELMQRAFLKCLAKLDGTYNEPVGCPILTSEINRRLEPHLHRLRNALPYDFFKILVQGPTDPVTLSPLFARPKFSVPPKLPEIEKPPAPPSAPGATPLPDEFKPPPPPSKAALQRFKVRRTVDGQTRRIRIYDDSGKVIGEGYSETSTERAKRRAEDNAMQELTKRYQTQVAAAKGQYEARRTAIQQDNDAKMAQYRKELADHQVSQEQYERNVKAQLEMAAKQQQEALADHNTALAEAQKSRAQVWAAVGTQVARFGWGVLRPHLINALVNSDYMGGRGTAFWFAATSAIRLSNIARVTGAVACYFAVSSAIVATSLSPFAPFVAPLVSSVLYTAGTNLIAGQGSDGLVSTGATSLASSALSLAGAAVGLGSVGSFAVSEAFAIAQDLHSAHSRRGELEKEASAVKELHERTRLWRAKLYQSGFANTPPEWGENLRALLTALGFFDKDFWRTRRVDAALDNIPQLLYSRMCSALVSQARETADDTDVKRLEDLHLLNDQICEWVKPAIRAGAQDKINRVVRDERGDSGIKLEFLNSSWHHCVLSALLGQAYRNQGHRPCPLLQPVNGVVLNSGEYHFLQQTATCPFSSQTLVASAEKLNGEHISYYDELIATQLAQVVFGLAELQAKFAFTAHILLPSSISIAEVAKDTTLYYSLPKNLGADNPRIEIRLPLNFAPLVKLSNYSCASAEVPDAQDGHIRVRLCPAASWTGAMMEELVRLSLPDNPAGSFQSAWDLHMFFRDLSITTTMDLWRHPLVAAFWEAEFLQHVKHSGHLPRCMAVVYGDVIFHQLPKSQYMSAILALPQDTAKLTALEFSLMLYEDDYRLLKVHPSLPGLLDCNVDPNRPPPSFSSDVRAIKFPANLNHQAWLDMIAVQPSSFVLSELLPILDFTVAFPDRPLTRGKSGDLIYAAIVEGRPAILKRFEFLESDPTRAQRFTLTSAGKPNFHCGAVLQEFIVSILAGSLYDMGLSPHFPRVYATGRLDRKIAQNPSNWLSLFKRREETTPEAGLKEVYLVSEFIDGDTLNRGFDKVIAQLQNAAHRANRLVYGREVYIHNAIAQVVLALEAFQRYLGGMHNDLHLGNVMVKLCDDTPYLTREGPRALRDIPYFEYEIPQNFGTLKLRLPNLGFVVKIIDFGLSSVRLYPGALGKDFMVGKDPVVFAPQPSSPLWTLARAAAHTATKDFPRSASLVQRFLAADAIRKTGSFRPAMDLQTFGNHLSSHPLYFRNSATMAYERAELSEHAAADSNVFAPLKVDLFYSLFGSLATARVPVSIEAAKLTPAEFLMDSEFVRYRSDIELPCRWPQIAEAEKKVEEAIKIKEMTMMYSKELQNLAASPNKAEDMQLSYLQIEDRIAQLHAKFTHEYEGDSPALVSLLRSCETQLNWLDHWTTRALAQVSCTNDERIDVYLARYDLKKVPPGSSELLSVLHAALGPSFPADVDTVRNLEPWRHPEGSPKHPLLEKDRRTLLAVSASAKASFIVYCCEPILGRLPWPVVVGHENPTTGTFSLAFCQNRFYSVIRCQNWRDGNLGLNHFGGDVLQLDALLKRDSLRVLLPPADKVAVDSLPWTLGHVCEPVLAAEDVRSQVVEFASTCRQVPQRTAILRTVCLDDEQAVRVVFLYPSLTNSQLQNWCSLACKPGTPCQLDFALFFAHKVQRPLLVYCLSADAKTFQVREFCKQYSSAPIGIVYLDVDRFARIAAV